MKQLLLFFLLCSFFSINSQDWGEEIITQQNVGRDNVFGFSIAIDGDYAVIGSPGENQGTGSVHIYKKEKNVWSFIQTIDAYLGKAADEEFGWSVAIQGDFIFVGSPEDRLNESNFTIPSGSVFIYKNDGNDNFTGIQRLRNSDASHSDFFGGSLAVSGNYLIVGAPEEDHDEAGLNSISTAGSVYIFFRDEKNDTWSEVQKIVPSNRGRNHYFAETIAAHGDYFIASSRSNTDENNANPVSGVGSVFVFKRDGANWSEIQKIKPVNPIESSQFGTGDLDIHGDFIVVGGHNTESFDNGNNYNGYVYIFKKDANDNWNENQILRIDDSNNFGQGIAINSNFLLISDPYKSVMKDGVNYLNAGKSYLYQREANDQYELKTELVTSLVQTNSYIGTGLYDNYTANYATALGETYFMLGAPYYDTTDGGVEYLTSGMVFGSGSLNSIMAALSTEQVNSKRFVAYPNPVGDWLTIQFHSEFTEKTKVIIYNVLGKKLYEEIVAPGLDEIQLNFAYPKGVYIAKLENNTGKTSSIRLVKH